METRQMKIEGMTCGGCVRSVTSVLQAVPGVASVAVSLEGKSATVTFDPAKAGTDALKRAVEDAGYEVTA